MATKKATTKRTTKAKAVKPKAVKPEPKIVVQAERKILGQDKVKKALEVAVQANIPALLIGETGAGKTSLVRELARKHGKRFMRFNMTGETSVDEFVGKYTLIDGGTVWQDGMLIEAMKTGAWMVVDELNLALPDIITVLNSLLDDDRSITLAHHDGERVECHPDFRFFGTMNPSDEYAGTKEVNKALMSRFGQVLEVKYPSKAIETKILTEVGVPETIAKEMVDIALQIRQSKTEGRVYYTCSTRDLLHWAALLDHLGLQAAFEYALVNKAPNDRDQLLTCYRSVSKQYEELDSLKERLNVEEELERLKTIDHRESQVKYQEERLAELRRMAEEELQRVKQLEAKTREEIHKELAQEITERMQRAVEFVQAF